MNSTCHRFLHSSSFPCYTLDISWSSLAYSCALCNFPMWPLPNPWSTCKEKNNGRCWHIQNRIPLHMSIELYSSLDLPRKYCSCTHVPGTLWVFCFFLCSFWRPRTNRFLGDFGHLNMHLSQNHHPREKSRLALGILFWVIFFLLQCFASSTLHSMSNRRHDHKDHVWWLPCQHTCYRLRRKNQ